MYFFIIDNANISDKMSALRKIEKKLDSALDSLTERLNVAREQYKKLREFHEEYHGVPQNKAEDIALYYIQFLNRRAYYYEMDNIVDIINAEPFMPNPATLVPSLDEKDIIEYISEHI